MLGVKKKNILELCDFDNVNSIDISELQDYMSMSLQELKPHEPSELLKISILTALYWIDELKETKNYTSTAYND